MLSKFKRELFREDFEDNDEWQEMLLKLLGEYE